jgi:FAD binding domain-containing protein
MITSSAVHQLKSHFRGELILPDDQRYDIARAVFNVTIDRRPALIARCAGRDDVIQAVNLAREENLLVAVRGTGHNVAGFAVCDEGLVIDLSHMKGITVDPPVRTVRAEGGCNWGEVNDALQADGLAATGGFVSVTGVSGLTLGGGLGWLVRKHGLALDNLLSAEVVLADGRFITASASENDDLFWAIRGGGDNFGVVSSFEFQVHPVATVLAGIVLHPATAGATAIAGGGTSKPRPRTSPPKARFCSISQTTPRHPRRCVERRSSASAASTRVRWKKASRSCGPCASTGLRLPTCFSRCRTTPRSAWQISSGRPASIATGNRAISGRSATSRSMLWSISSRGYRRRGQ